MHQFAIAGLWAGFRGRSFRAIMLLGMALIAVAYLSSGFSPRQPQTVALDVGLSGLRFVLILLALFWVQELLAKEIERKTIFFSLAYPVPRYAFLLGRFLAVCLLLALSALCLAFLLQIAVLMAGAGYEQGFAVDLGIAFWLTVTGLLLDAILVAAFAFFITCLSTVSILPFALGAAFAVGGKALGATLDYLARGADGDMDMQGKYLPAVRAIRIVLPDLSRLDWRENALYSLPVPWEEVSMALLMWAGYLGLILLLACCQFAKREFS